jgi:hypothetical protein
VWPFGPAGENPKRNGRKKAQKAQKLNSRERTQRTQRKDREVNGRLELQIFGCGQRAFFVNSRMKPSFV